MRSHGDGGGGGCLEKENLIVRWRVRGIKGERGFGLSEFGVFGEGAVEF